MTAEPRDVEDWCGSPVSHEPHPGCSGWPSVEARDFIETAKILAEPYNETIAALEARLAAADRENAELRGEVERLREELAGEEAARYEWSVEDRAENEVLAGERDDLRAQLAAAQAQLRDLSGIAVPKSAWDEVNARLEAVREVAEKMRQTGHTYWPDQVHAALSAAPQPEPDRRPINARFYPDVEEEPLVMVDLDDEPPASDEPDEPDDQSDSPNVGSPADEAASDEPARCGHGRKVGHWLNAGSAVGLPPWCPGPAASGAPDGGR